MTLYWNKDWLSSLDREALESFAMHERLHIMHATNITLAEKERLLAEVDNMVAGESPPGAPKGMLLGLQIRRPERELYNRSMDMVMELYNRSMDTVMELYNRSMDTVTDGVVELVQGLQPGPRPNRRERRRQAALARQASSRR